MTDEVPVFITGVKGFTKERRGSLTRDQVLGIYRCRLPAKVVARAYGVSLSIVYKIWEGQSYRKITGHVAKSKG